MVARQLREVLIKGARGKLQACVESGGVGRTGGAVGWQGGGSDGGEATGESEMASFLSSCFHLWNCVRTEKMDTLLFDGGNG